MEVIDQRRRDLGGFEVGRVLPFVRRHMVGPFIFFDHIGPVTFAAGIPKSVDVRPHPHIGLATVTYLFAGEIMHRDSVGAQQAIQPNEVNWMIAGSGITHSERFEKARASRRPDARHPVLGGAARGARGNGAVIRALRLRIPARA
jgi:redox-sensitive bicupin YhaK (pirin superfamily)